MKLCRIYEYPGPVGKKLAERNRGVCSQCPQDLGDVVYVLRQDVGIYCSPECAECRWRELQPVPSEEGKG